MTTPPYVIKLTNGLTLTSIQEGTIDSTTSLNLLGRRVSQYGENVATNLVHLLENAANVTAPSAPLTGQLWYDSSIVNHLKVYDGVIWHSLVTQEDVSVINSQLNLATTLIGDVTGTGTSPNPITVTLKNAPAASVSDNQAEKITYNSKGIVTSGSMLTTNDISNAVGSTQSSTLTIPNLTLTSGLSGKIKFADGTQQATAARTKVTGLTLYVSASGSDSNDGKTNSTPIKTLQHAADVAYYQYDTQGTIVTIQVASGNYTAGVTISGSGPTLHFVGNTTTPTLCQVNLTSGGQCFGATLAGSMIVSGFYISSLNASNGGSGTADSYGLNTTEGGVIYFDHINFGKCALAHINSGTSGYTSNTSPNTPYTISGSALYHMIAGAAGGTCSVSYCNVTAGANVSFNAYAWADSSGLIFAPGYTFTAGSYTVTGAKYIASTGGNIVTGFGGANFFPGSTAGATTSGYYI